MLKDEDTFLNACPCARACVRACVCVWGGGVGVVLHYVDSLGGKVRGPQDVSQSQLTLVAYIQERTRRRNFHLVQGYIHVLRVRRYIHKDQSFYQRAPPARH